MAGFIEEFYYGNIEPQARGINHNKNVQKAMQILSKNEDILTERLSDEEKKLFIEYVDAWGEVNGTSDLDSFIVGFRLGASFAYDVFASSEAPFYDYLKEK
ncbi:MAG: hypothetical protein BGN88_03455 [Clostridiales bacterium 43-6]|nr:MAG: hypothetical protein BGN88_03455 [Clostridiales bacterium 43-6]